MHKVFLTILIIFKLFLLAITSIAFIAQELPQTCTSIIALVLWVIAASIFFGSRFNVFRSI